MTKDGIVVSTNDNKATVIINRSSACGGSCESCSSCSENKVQTIVCGNEIGAKVGDNVIISSEKTPLVKLTVLLYILPLCFFIVGLLVAYTTLEGKVSNVEMISFLIGLVALLVAYGLIEIIDNRFSKNQLVNITKIVGGIYE
ncbi:MAG: SoxR reducing system RseC family protein [Finegoldia sp.]|nr:SoxR reducing system RseC family protein [Finegoldia sp.]